MVGNLIQQDKWESHESQIAKDCLLTMVKSSLALGSPGWLVGCSFVTMPKMAEYTDN